MPKILGGIDEKATAVIPSEVEGSRGVTVMLSSRDSSAALGMTAACQHPRLMPTWKTMKAFAIYVCLFCLAAVSCATARAQTETPTPTPSPENRQLELLAKKIDEQSAKIDALSQQLLKIEQQLSKPGVMIGESTPATPVPVLDPARANTSSHTVARGETLTSIAKMHRVGVEELQRFNHIENDRKLQIGQVIQIPVSGVTAPASSTSPTPSPQTSGD